MPKIATEIQCRRWSRRHLQDRRQGRGPDRPDECRTRRPLPDPRQKRGVQAPVCNRLGITSHGLALYLLEGADEKFGIACLGGECFGDAGRGFLRFSLASPTSGSTSSSIFSRSPCQGRAALRPTSKSTPSSGSPRLTPLRDEFDRFSSGCPDARAGSRRFKARRSTCSRGRADCVLAGALHRHALAQFSLWNAFLRTPISCCTFPHTPGWAF